MPLSTIFQRENRYLAEGKSERVPTSPFHRVRLPFVTRPDSTHNRRFRQRFHAAAAAQEQKQINDLLKELELWFSTSRRMPLCRPKGIPSPDETPG